MNDQNVALSLSQFSARRVFWKTIQDSALGLGDMGGENSVQPSDLDKIKGRAKRILKVARDEFAKQLRVLRIVIKGLALVAGGAVIVALAGVALSVQYGLVVPGSVMSTGSVAILLTILRPIVQLTRDQAMLELVPARYELAIQVATSPEHLKDIIDRFLDETSSMARSG